MLLVKNTISDAPSFLDKVAGRTGVEQAGITSILGQVVSIAIALTGIIFLLLTIYGGFLWMTARGKEEQITKAKDTIKRSIFGFILVVGSYALVTFLISALF